MKYIYIFSPFIGTATIFVLFRYEKKKLFTKFLFSLFLLIFETQDIISMFYKFSLFLPYTSETLYLGKIFYLFRYSKTKKNLNTIGQDDVD